MQLRLRYAVFVIAAAIAVGTHLRLDKLINIDEQTRRQNTLLPSVETVRLASGGFEKLASDIYWLAFIQYCGDPSNQRGKNYSHAYEYVDLITGLDPFFTKPYWFGCWAIGYWQKRPDLALKILERGMQFNPESWELPYLAGINEYLFDHKYKLAAHYYRVAAKQPGAPNFLLRHAQILESPIPELVKRAHMLYRMYDDARDPNYKSATYHELLDVLEEMYRSATVEINRQGIRKQIDDLKRNYADWSGEEQ
jgi:hypothetical protein